ncbi:MAG: hypothetical protein EOP20_07365 [Hyphomicrobiales bacterium]|nr:MAG: hypothetical protein EOP20_07365 [Hyphomicrobiales bacterium]
MINVDGNRFSGTALIGRQFSLLATTADMDAIFRLLTDAGDVDFLSSIGTDDLTDLVPLDGLPKRDVTKCYLAPRHLPKRISVERLSAVKWWIHIEKSCLIECVRPYYDDSIMRYGRLFYIPKEMVNATWCEKDPRFTKWATHVSNRVKRSLTRDPVLLAYVGAEAAAAIASGRLRVGNY